MLLPRVIGEQGYGLVLGLRSANLVWVWVWVRVRARYGWSDLVVVRSMFRVKDLNDALAEGRALAQMLLPRVVGQQGPSLGSRCRFLVECVSK